MAPVPTFTAVLLGKPDPAILDTIDSSNVDAIGTDNFHGWLYPIIVHIKPPYCCHQLWRSPIGDRHVKRVTSLRAVGVRFTAVTGVFRQ
jgi:hypothetical protein